MLNARSRAYSENTRDAYSFVKTIIFFITANYRTRDARATTATILRTTDSRTGARRSVANDAERVGRRRHYASRNDHVRATREIAKKDARKAGAATLVRGPNERSDRRIRDASDRTFVRTQIRSHSREKSREMRETILPLRGSVGKRTRPWRDRREGGRVIRPGGRTSDNIRGGTRFVAHCLPAFYNVAHTHAEWRMGSRERE